MRASFVRVVGLASVLMVGLLASPGCNKSGPPTSFGVDVTVDASMLSATNLGNVKVGVLLVTGDEPRVKRFPVTPEITTGKLTFQYIPNITSGTLTFEFDAVDTAGALYGTGTSKAVTLAADKAVSVTITLTPKNASTKGIGANCNTATACNSGFCVDGVCCENSCQTTCSSCGRGDNAGLCTGYDAGTDPEGECAGSTMGGGDGGAPVDAATDAQMINPPDGGIIATPGLCGGTCNGEMACATFANAGTVCGTPFCNSRRELGSPLCDGKGTCGVGLSTCANGYACGPATAPPACHTNCNANGDCAGGYYCNGTTSMCAPVKVDGLTCATDAECLHEHCVGAGQGVNGVCCNTACASPNTCNNSGSAGTCTCPGVTCAAGVSCAVFYPDADGDSYGDKTATIAAGTAKAACANSTQPGFVLDNTDCDDHDANVNPAQTGYFATASKGVGTFDYNCDGTLEKGINEYASNATCTFCPSCSAGCGTGASACAASGDQASLACPREGGICLSTIVASETLLMSVQPVATASIVTPPPIIIKIACCGCDDHAGFLGTVNCGTAGTYATCGSCNAQYGGVLGSSSNTTTKQTCH